MSIDLSALRRIISDEERLLSGGDIPREYLSEEVAANAARVRTLALQNGALDFIELTDSARSAPRSTEGRAFRLHHSDGSHRPKSD